MPVTFYGLTSCDTCRAALKAIAAAGIDIDRKDVRADGVPADIRQSAKRQVYQAILREDEAVEASLVANLLREEGDRLLKCIVWYLIHFITQHLLNIKCIQKRHRT